jgi:choline monooxygenase
MLNRYGPILDTNTVLPLAHDRTLVLVDFFIRRGEGEGAQRFLEQSMQSTNRIQHEDIAICESVQRGLRSGSYDTGRYSVTREAPMHHFHRLLAADFAGAPLSA